MGEVNFLTAQGFDAIQSRGSLEEMKVRTQGLFSQTAKAHMLTENSMCKCEIGPRSLVESIVCKCSMGSSPGRADGAIKASRRGRMM